MMPVIVDTISYPIEDSPGAALVGEDAHRPGPSPYLAEIPLQDIGGAYLFPELPGEGIIVEAVVEVLLHAPDRSLGFHLPFLLPGFEAVYRFAPAGSGEDSFSLGHAGFQVHPFHLDSHVSQLVNDAPLNFEERIDLIRCLEQGRVTVGGDELQGPTLDSPALEVYQESPPAVGIFLVCHPEGERLPGAVFFHPQPAEWQHPFRVW